ncbi:hypothetical protein LCGC14_2875240 [marine sediment metagenome]|uniref:Uncharacterized protein n=1 Tax=marine sediment metagenome TaxID=412755 RepID=A0A0F9ASW7_9ZZZZ
MCEKCIDGRYWVDDNILVPHPYGDNTLGIVDEHAGGIVAYVGNVKLAIQLIKLLEADDV